MLRVPLARIFSLTILFLLAITTFGQTTPTSIAVSTSGTRLSGTLASVTAVDGNCYVVASALWAGTYQQSGIETDFTIGGIPTGVQSCGFVVTSKAASGCTLFTNIYNWSTGVFDFIVAHPVSGTSSDVSVTLTTAQIPKYVNSTGQVRCVFRALRPTRISSATFNWSVDRVQFYYAPTAATSLAAVGQTRTQIGLTWTNGSANSSSIIVQRRLTTSSTFSTVATVAGTATSYTDNNLTPATSYTYRIAGVNFGGQAPYSNEATALTSVSSPPNLVALSLTDDVLGSSGSTTGKVTLDGLVTTATVVTLSRTNTAFTVPTSVTVPAGASSATFTVTGPATSGLVQGQIVAQLRDWTQTADIAAASSLTVTGIQTDEGWGCVHVSWDSLDYRLLNTTLAGYVVKRTAGGTTVNLNSVPTKLAMFVDTTGAEGITYTYQVVLVNRLGAVVGSSAILDDNSSTSGHRVTWQTLPPANAAGQVTVRGVADTNTTVSGGAILVDGVLVGTISSQTGVSGASPLLLSGTLDTRTLSNGAHTVQLMQYLEPGIAVSTPTTVNVTNALLLARIDDDFDSANTSDYSVFRVSTVNPLSAWTLTVRNSAGTAIRTWTSTVQNASVCWDGKTSSGAAAGDGDFNVSFAVTAGAGIGGAVGITVPVTSHTGDPTALAMIQLIPEDEYSTGASAGFDYANKIQGIFGSLRSSHSGFYGMVIKRKPGGSFGPKLVANVRRWLGSSVNDFYIYDHGSPTEINFSGMSILSGPYLMTTLKGRTMDMRKRSPNSLYMRAITPTRGHLFNSVFLDCCNTAGGNTVTGAPGVVSHAFRIAFGMNSASQCFVAWNGYSGTLRYPGSDDLSQWGSFYNLYWDGINSGRTVVNSLLYAISRMTGSFGFHPDDTDRLYYYGDTTLPLP